MPNPNTLLKHEFERLARSRDQTPPGYHFVPKGDVYITRHCRDATADAGAILYIVYDERIGHRTGLLCPAGIHASVLRMASETKAARKTAVAATDARALASAAATVRRLYPRMPREQQQAVLDHGFKKGSRRVGRTGLLDGEEKVRLAVRAHVRHVWTDYDELMRAGVGREKARGLVAEPMEEVIREWTAGGNEGRVVRTGMVRGQATGNAANEHRGIRLPSVIEIDSVEVRKIDGAGRKPPRAQTSTTRTKQTESSVKVTRQVSGGRVTKPKAGASKTKVKAKRNGKTKKTKASGRGRW